MKKLMMTALMLSMIAACKDARPRPRPLCHDYVRSMSALRTDVASCRWPEQSMRLERRVLGKDLIHCTCPVDAREADKDAG